MKFKTHGIILSLFFALGLVFSFSIDASGSHGDGTGITAEQVAANPDETSMKAFVNHIVDYYNEIREPLINDLEANRAELIRQLTVFARDIRREGGDYRHGEVYAMGITDNNVITNHARYPELIGYKVDPDAGTPLANTFKALLGGSTIGNTNCENYGQNKVACAAKVESDFTVDVTNIAGLHHDDIDDSAFIPPACEGLSLETTAKEVYDDPTDANLEAYVKDVIEAVQKDIASISLEETGKVIRERSLNPANPMDLAMIAELSQAPITTRIQQRLFCFGSEDKGFKHKNIYVFMMDADPAHSTVLFNGNNFDLNGSNLELSDEELDHEDQTIAGLFNRELAKAEEAGGVGSSAYVDYRWDDPLDDNDNPNSNWFEDRVVPGTSHKRSYIEVADLYAETPGAPQQLYIFGSGTYPETGDDDGCAIAGTGHTSQGTLLNVFLIASVLFSVVFLRRRA